MLIKPTLWLTLKGEGPMPLHPRDHVNPASGLSLGDDDVPCLDRLLEIEPLGYTRGRFAFEVTVPNIEQRFAGNLQSYWTGELKMQFWDVFTETERTCGWGPYLRRLR